MRVCVAGPRGKTSLIRRLLYDEFSLRTCPTTFITMYHAGDWEFVEVPLTAHGRPMKCDVLLLCGTQCELVDLARAWFGYHRSLFVVVPVMERPVLCPLDRLFCVDSMSNEGIEELKRALCSIYIGSK
jgi:hypothetical protein